MLTNTTQMSSQATLERILSTKAVYRYHNRSNKAVDYAKTRRSQASALENLDPKAQIRP